MMERKKRSLFQLAVALVIALLLLVVPQAVHAEEQAQASTAYVTMYRLYNPNSGEHLYTKDSNEVSVLTKIGWKKEGEAWKAAKSGTAVYRLYNPNNGDHHYTLDKNEYNTLGRIGWRKEGVAWYSDSNKGVAVYRLFNPSQTGTGSHHYTTDKNEYRVLKTKGWNQEGISWYGVKVGNTSSSTSTTTNKPKAKYSYELYTTVSTIYSGYEIPIFIKTDNPEYFFADRSSYATSSGIPLFPPEYYSSGETFRLSSNGEMSVRSTRYDDVQYLNDESDTDEYTSGYYKVDGGYLTTISFDEAGTYSLYVVEYINGTVLNLGKVTVTVKDAQKCKDQWQYSVINQVTTDAMDPFEKMDAIRSYLLNNFKYYKNDGLHYHLVYLYNLIADAGKPYFETKEWDSAVSPAVLCQFAEKVGGFDEIFNCYNGDDWGLHDCARLTIGDEIRYYSACPAWHLNMIENVDRFNLLHSNLLRKL